MDSYSKLLELVNTSGCFAPANHMYVTLDCSMQYLAPASGAHITCTATPRKLGKTVLVYEAVLTDDTGRTVATGVYTFFAKGPAN